MNFGSMFWILAILTLGLVEAALVDTSMPIGAAHHAQPRSAVPNDPLPTKEQQQEIDSDISRHIGSSPPEPGPLAKSLSRDLTPENVVNVIRKVADWQLSQSKGYYGTKWWWGVLYSGFIAASKTTGDSTYHATVQAAAETNNWQTVHNASRRFPSADDASVATPYLELYLASDKKNESWIADSKAVLDLAYPEKTAPTGEGPYPWWYVDALYMGPQAWARLYLATNDQKYLNYIRDNWQLTYGKLFDNDAKLWYRDESYVKAIGKNGKPMFWARGQGWAMAGIARFLPLLPKDDPEQRFYKKNLRSITASIVALQDNKTGLWHTSLFDPENYPSPEISASALIAYAIAWGVNNNVLPPTFKDTVKRAWSGLLDHVYEDGRLGGIQQTGHEPAYFLPQSSFVYGVGAFLLLGDEVKNW